MDSFVDKLLSAIRNGDGPSLKDVFAKSAPEESAQLHALIQEKLARAPRIVVIGKTGVGKSTTINALFGTSLSISHTKSCTQFENEIALQRNARDHLVIFDMPGLLEDLDADERHKDTYARIIPQCDVAVWILDATDRAIAGDQLMIRDVVAPANRELVDRLVVGINKVDIIQPGKWLMEPNIPSQSQKESITRRIEDVTEKLLKVCPRLTTSQIVAYSAERRYKLHKLFNAMLDACPKERAWVLKSRGSIARYEDLVNPEILRSVRSSQGGRP